MSNVIVQAGVCGFTTEVTAKLNGRTCELKILTTCPNIENMSEELTEVNPMREISYRGEGPQTFEAAKKHLPHPACPVPPGIIKANDQILIVAMALETVEIAQGETAWVLEGIHARQLR